VLRSRCRDRAGVWPGSDARCYNETTVRFSETFVVAAAPEAVFD
jgi:hypothetical protein